MKNRPALAGHDAPAITAALDVPTGEGLCTATIGSLGTSAANHRGGTDVAGMRPA